MRQPVVNQPFPDEYFLPPELRAASASSGPSSSSATTLPSLVPAMRVARPVVDPSDSPVRDDSGYEEEVIPAPTLSTLAPASTTGAVVLSSTGAAGPEVLLLAAPPACGKSTLARRYEAAGYVRINQDTLGSVDKCLAAARQALQGQVGRSVCVDNTNMDPATRQKWVQLAKQCGVQVLYVCACIYCCSRAYSYGFE